MGSSRLWNKMLIRIAKGMSKKTVESECILLYKAKMIKNVVCQTVSFTIFSN